MGSLFSSRAGGGGEAYSRRRAGEVSTPGSHHLLPQAGVRAHRSSAGPGKPPRGPPPSAGGVGVLPGKQLLKTLGPTCPPPPVDSPQRVPPAPRPAVRASRTECVALTKQAGGATGPGPWQRARGVCSQISQPVPTPHVAGVGPGQQRPLPHPHGVSGTSGNE